MLLPVLTDAQRAVAKLVFEIVLFVAVVIGIFAMGWSYGNNSATAKLQAYVEAQAQAAADAERQLREDIATREEMLISQEKDFAQKYAALVDAQSKRPARTVRVCPQNRTSEVPGVPASGRSDPNPTAGDGELSGGVGQDIGPGLQALVDRADRILLKCVAQQDRTDLLAKQPGATVPVSQ